MEVMEFEEEWEKEEESGGLKTRQRKGKIGNLEANETAVAVVMVEEKVQDSETCVYLDREKGLWKCHHCNWTHQMEIPGIDHFHSWEECSNGVMNFKTSSQQGSCFGLHSKGIGSADETMGTNFSSIHLFNEVKQLGKGPDFEQKSSEIQKGLSLVSSHESSEHTNDESQSCLIMISSEGQCDDRPEKLEPINDRSGTIANGSIMDAGKIVVEMDVERVLEEQDTHDLYCPNCNSCITKRVILRKRKRIVRDIQVDAKHEESQPSHQPDVEDHPDAVVKTEPDVFRCLSCFTYFISTATGFKLFPIFGRKDGSESPQSPQQTPTENLNCITSIFEILTGKMSRNEPGKINLPISAPPQSEENVSAVMAPGMLPETEIEMPVNDASATTHEWDILKSIVYGGLIESITSLGVVSSAAGSDATTLNIVALGVANLISGLIVIIHNLRELKRSSIDQERGELDRYQATLGRRENFRLHATVSVLSYAVFGLLPPIIYGLSFRKSDNREYKLIAVAAASLLCITLLAVGKAHVRSRNYISTVLYYLGTGVMASGLSYVVGELIGKLLEKLGWFESSAAASVSSNLPFLDTVTVKSRLPFY